MTLTKQLAELKAAAERADLHGYWSLPSPDRILSLVAEVERLIEANRWIPVSERLPETDTPHLVVSFHVAPFVTIAHCGFDKNWRMMDGLRIPVNFWRPLPAPPDHIAGAGKMEGGR